jgi:DNA (cytosine-5)-methyltransferase 1
MTLKILDLFSGIGGFSYAAERLVGGFETIGFCEIDPYCQKILKKHWPDVPVHDDVRKLADDADRFRGLVDVVCGGFPCQPFSLASAKRKGQEDDRHLWPQMLRIIQATRPRFVIGENVAGHITLGLDNVLSDLEAENYTARAFVIPACAKDAKHRRDRVWIVAHTSSGKRQSRPEKQGTLREVPENRREHDYSGGSGEAYTAVFPDTTSQRQQRQRKLKQPSSQEKEAEGQADNAFTIGEPHIWATESTICRTLDGVSNRMDRLKSLGNSIVPQVAAEIFIAIKAMADGQEK